MPRIVPMNWRDLKPKQREMMRVEMKSGAYPNPWLLRILGHTDHDAAPAVLDHSLQIGFTWPQLHGDPQLPDAKAAADHTYRVALSEDK